MGAPGSVDTLSGNDYEKWITKYINTHFSGFGLKALRQVSFGRHRLGIPDKNDIFIKNKDGTRYLLVECKTQDTSGSKDEALIYAITNAEEDPNRALIYRGKSFSNGIWNRLLQSRSCWFCSPNKAIEGGPLRYSTAKKLKQGEPEEGDTWELDHLLFVHFGLINEWMEDPTWRSQD